MARTSPPPAPLGIEVALAVPPAAAVDRVTAALGAEGFGVLTRIDAHAVFRQKLGREFREYTILGACNPELAHTSLSREPEVGLLLPCNVTVEAAPGGSTVRIADPAVLLGATRLEADPALREVMQQARARLLRVADGLAAATPSSPGAGNAGSH